ncbi:hypothetical protein ASC94_13315 [Massilia sp. Root418]|nr:hypothetical protein ASC94_13315 [Massilia sp. Root418]
MMLREMRKTMGIKAGDPIFLLVVASAFRDEMPWMYEIGMEAYRMARDGTAEEAVAALRRFQRMADVMRHNPFGPDEVESESRMMMHMMVRELDHLLEMESDTLADSESSNEQTPNTTGHRARNSKVSA